MDKDLLVSVLSGSRAYGVHNENSDIDIRGVFTQSQREKMSPFENVKSSKGEGEDTLYYELSQYLQLVFEQNPNVMDYIWTEEKDIISMKPEWNIIRNQRYDLLSKRAKDKYYGFAKSTKAKMNLHERWNNNPPKQPLPKDFIKISHNLTLANRNMPTDMGYILFKKKPDEYALYPYDKGTWFDKEGNLRYLDDKEHAILETKPLAYCSFNRTQFEKQKMDYHNYKIWIAERNTAKTKGVELIGYDTKQAYHLIRVLRTGTEILKEGLIRVKRPDAEELKAIRRGSFSLEKIEDLAKRETEALFEAYEKSPLPDFVDKNIIANISHDIYTSLWKKASMISIPVLPQNDKEKLPPKDGRVLVFDIEGSGYHGGNKYNITELAILEMIDGKFSGNMYHSWFNPDVYPNPYIFELTGQSEEFLKNKPRFKDCIKDIFDFIGDSPLIAHSAISDYKLINHDLKLAGAETIPYDRIACSQKISNYLFDGKNISLNSVCDILGIDTTKRKKHGALIDTQLLVECMELIMDYPNYNDIKSAWLSKKNILSKEQKLTLKKNAIENRININGNEVSFKNNDGDILKVKIDFPETYNLHIKGTSVLICPPNERKPENPIGPAVVFLTKNGIDYRNIGFKEENQIMELKI